MNAEQAGTLIDLFSAERGADLKWRMGCAACGVGTVTVTQIGADQFDAICSTAGCTETAIRRAASAKLRKQAGVNGVNGARAGEEKPEESECEVGEVRSKPRQRPAIQIYTLAALQNQELADPKIIVPDLVLEGFNLYAGKFKTGKSFFVLNLAAAIAMGGKALGHFQVAQGDVLYLALEDTPRRLKKRALLQLRGSPWPANAHVAHDWPVVGQGCLGGIRKWLDEHPETRLVIIDTLKKIRPVRSGARSAYDDDYDFITDLKEIADEYAIGMIGLTHTRKAAAEDVFDTINASTGMGASADTIVVWERKRGTPYVKLHVTGRDVDEEKVDDTALVLQWDREIASWAYAGTAKEILVSDERREIAKVMEKAGKAISPSEIAKALDKNTSTVQNLLIKMLEEDVVEKAAYGRYRLAGGGLEREYPFHTPIESLESIESYRDDLLQ